MSLLPHQLELLSPARDADIGIEAINHGADAVYMGGPAFGARSAAGNSLEDIEALARHAHRFGAQVFVAFNTLLHDHELEQARPAGLSGWADMNQALLHLEVGDTEDAEGVFSTLMGDVVEPRRDFIQENALKVVNLDI